ncbi:MAG: hypothetical protein E6K70_24195 [Planctomycetota bacterium]|nr:MAG: hypothetical protein E6K70_24195 [Planctomycetota bacterium]
MLLLHIFPELQTFFPAQHVIIDDELGCLDDLFHACGLFFARRNDSAFSRPLSDTAGKGQFGVAVDGREALSSASVSVVFLVLPGIILATGKSRNFFKPAPFARSSPL